MAAEMKVTDAVAKSAEEVRVRTLNAIAAYGSAGVEERHMMAMRAALEAGLAAMLEPVGWQQRYARPLPNGDRCQWWECSETDMEKIRSQFSDSYELRRIYADKESK